MEWKWKKSEPYEKSRRLDKNTQKEIQFVKINTEQELSAYSSSLNYDENTWDMLNQSVAKNGFQTKREEIGNKMADRSLVQQTNINPFLEQNNYVEDIFIRDKFLKPINTTNDKINENVCN